MSRDETALPWPIIARWAMMKGEGRGRGRYSHMDHLERLAALREFRGGPWGDRPPFGPGRRQDPSVADAGAGAAATCAPRC